ncbi:MAG: hypothetical protein WBD66_07720, partial [Candidatus Acidiferrales bacterium]
MDAFCGDEDWPGFGQDIGQDTGKNGDKNREENCMGHPLLDLTGKTAVVIGGTSGIGLALSREL